MQTKEKSMKMVFK